MTGRVMFAPIGTDIGDSQAWSDVVHGTVQFTPEPIDAPDLPVFPAGVTYTQTFRMDPEAHQRMQAIFARIERAQGAAHASAQHATDTALAALFRRHRLAGGPWHYRTTRTHRGASA